MRALLVPVKRFESAKLRLAPVLSPEQRRYLARHLAEGVIASAGDMTPFVVCEDEDVAVWAKSLGVDILVNRRVGLSRAVTAAVTEVASRGYDTAVVAHADLARPAGLSTVVLDSAVVLVPDLRQDGTNIASVPTRAGFRFAYGAGSFERHRAEARRLGIPCVVVHDRLLAADVDEAEDLQRVSLPTMTG